MRRFIFLWILILLGPSLVEAQQASIDHIITLIPEDHYDSSIEDYQNNGFIIKQGRKHSNGLYNSHIKFRNGSSLELMTVQGEPKDEIAKDYMKIMKEVETGAYIALKVTSASDASIKLKKMGIENKIIKNRLWNYVTFPSNSPENLFFLIEMKTSPDDLDSLYLHKNGSVAIGNVFFNGNEDTRALLQGLGLYEEPHFDTEFGACQLYKTQTGNLILLNEVDIPSSLSRIKKIIFFDKDSHLVFTKSFD